MGGETMGRVILLFFAIVFMIAGCKTSKTTEQVPVLLPQHHERTETNSDSVHTTDCVHESHTSILQEVDSGYLAGLGIVKPPPKAWLLRESKNKSEKKNTEHTGNQKIIERDTVPEPYPVTEYKYINELYWWQEALMWAGAAYLLLIIIKLVIFVYKLKKRI